VGARRCASLPSFLKLIHSSSTKQSEPYAFTHLLFVSRAYHLSPAEEEALANRAPSKKSSKAKKQKGPQPPAQAPPEDGVYSFHPEDACIEEVCARYILFTFLSLLSLDFIEN
jgi:protein BCP1